MATEHNFHEIDVHSFYRS